MFINSEVNSNIYSQDEIRDFHLLLEKKGRNYLDHDSFVDCSEAFEMDVDSILSALKNNFQKTFIGTAAPSDLTQIQTKVGQSEKTIRRLKKKYLLVP